MPFGSLIASGEKLYGMTRNGGANDVGVVFKYDPLAGTCDTLVSFDLPVSGGNPIDNLLHIAFIQRPQEQGKRTKQLDVFVHVSAPPDIG